MDLAPVPSGRMDPPFVHEAIAEQTGIPLQQSSMERATNTFVRDAVDEMHQLGNARTHDPHSLPRPGYADPALDRANDYMMLPTGERDEQPALHGPGVTVTRPHGNSALPSYL